MSISLSSPVTGGAQTGFTAPTYTHVVDVAPDVNGKQYAVTALGGTQAGVTIHSQSSPFTVTYVRPKSFKPLGTPNPVTGVISSVPKNSHVFIVRKGVTVLAGYTPQVALIRCQIDIPSGADTVDPANLRAMISMLVGALNSLSAGVGDTVVTGVL